MTPPAATRDDQPRLTREVTPAHEEREIDGEGCGFCRSGQVALAVGGTP